MSLDRTFEFKSMAEALPPSMSTTNGSNGSNNNNNNGNKNSTESYAQLRSFHSTAGTISQDIASTSSLLSELTHMVRHQSSLWEQDQQQVQNLVFRIKNNMESLNARLDQAQQQLQSHKRQFTPQVNQQTRNLVDGLQQEFAQAATGFKQVLQHQTDKLKEKDEFSHQVYGNGSNNNKKSDNEVEPVPNLSLGAPPPVYGNNTPGKRDDMPMLDLTSNLLAQQQQYSMYSTPGHDTLPRPHGATVSSMRHRTPRTNSDVASSYYDSAPNSNNNYYDDSSNNALLTPLDLQRLDEESGQQMQLIPNQDYLQQRADAMSTVETNIVELGTIFNKLAVMVSEHQELVQRVEDNVQDANTNINLSLGALTDTLTNLRSNRMLALRLFAVIVVFIIVFIVGFA